MTRSNIYPVSAAAAATARMLTDEPIRIDGMKLAFDEKVALYPAKLRVEDRGSENGERNGDRQRSSNSDE